MVWTLHDVRPFTGGCHFPAGCDGFERDCGQCCQLRQDRWHVPRRSLRDQTMVLAESGVVIVTPSVWLAGLARRSGLFRQQRIETIPYGVPLAEFSPMSPTEARRRFGLAENGCYFLFGADYAAEKRKGLSELRAAVERLPPEVRGRFRLLTFGTSSPELEALGTAVQPLGYLRSSEELRAAYAAADYFVLTSLEDNLPCVMLESMACGTPVVAFASGGIPEVVRSGENGWTVPTGDVNALSALLQRLIESRAERAPLSVRASALIREEFGTDRETERYLALYRSLSPRPPSRPRRPAHLRRALPMLSVAIFRRFGLRTGIRLLRGKQPAPSISK
jgi:glycosyltransferase involved in cell wall biosynthesis